MAKDRKEVILAVDPGRMKCGLALIKNDEVIFQEVVPRESLLDRLMEKVEPNAVVVVGDRTGSKAFIKELADRFPNITVVKVDEHRSSDEARERYWKANPPRGLKALLPVSLQTPPVPIDDYVAVILAERYLNNNS